MLRERSLLIILGLITLLSRLPFLFAGYGSEDDSWGLVLNAQKMAESGEYSFSRLPGHPVQEYVLMLMPDAGPVWMNLLSALFGVLAVLAFAQILRFHGIRNWFLWSLVFASIPIIWISSTYTIDYVWALAFITLAWYMVLRGAMIPAGVLIGLAIGCRITSGAVLVGLIYIAIQSGKKSYRSVFYLGFCSLMFSAICYLPAYFQYGISFFDTYRLPYPSIPKVIYKASFGVWGFTGLLALLFLMVFRYRKRKVHPIVSYGDTGLLLNVLLYFIAFLVLPQKSAFWIPAIPFLLLWLLKQNLSDKMVYLLSALFLISPFSFGFNLSNQERGAKFSSLAWVKNIAGQEVFFDPLTGPLQIEQSRRMNRQTYVDAAVQAACQLNESDLILCGWWTNQFTVECQKQPGCKVQIAEFYNQSQLDSILQKGVRIWYLSEIEQANDERYSMQYTAKVSQAMSIKKN